MPACPVCGYDQSGLVASWEATCPLTGSCSECGSHIEWREVFRPDLYEERSYAEHPAAKMPRDAAKTARRAFRPGSLWRWIPRSQPLVLWRLLLSGAIGAVMVGIICPALLVASTTVALYVGHANPSPSPPINPALVPGSGSTFYSPANRTPSIFSSTAHQDPFIYAKHYIKYDLDISETVFLIVAPFHLSGIVVAALWAWLARHRGVQLRHILRFAVFTSIPVCLLANLDLAMVCLDALYWYDPLGVFSWIEPILRSFRLVVIVSIWISAAWLFRAWVLFLSRYLRARRPVLTATAYGVIAFLLVPAIVFGLPAIFG